MTEIWFYDNGKKVRVPTTPWMAEEIGWHHGAEYKSMFYTDTRGTEIADWCRARFDPHLFKVFMNNIWFYREQDAMLCKLMWQ